MTFSKASKICALLFFLIVINLHNPGFGQGVSISEVDKLIKAPPPVKTPTRERIIHKGSLSPPVELNSICFDSSRNGYGWANSTPKPIDYSYAQDVVGAAYRMFVPGWPNTSHGGWVRYKLPDLFIYSSLHISDLVDLIMPYELSVRNPILLATDTTAIAPLIDYNSGSCYLGLVVNTWGGPYGSITIDYIEIPLPWSSFSIYSADVVKTAANEYRIGLIVDYGFVLVGSPDGVQWNLLHYAQPPGSDSLAMNTPHFAWGSNGFGAWMSTGHFLSQPSGDYLPLISSTTDYGITWTTPQQYTWEQMGIPDSIGPVDSIYVPDPNNPGDSILYNGPAHVGLTYDFDFLIQPDNAMHLGGTLTWGPYTDSTETSFYPHPKWTGLYDFSSSGQGQSWNPGRIWINSGLNAGDSSGHFVFINEIDLGQDQQGTIYAAWVDRDPHNIVPSPFPRTNTNIYGHYNVDIWASRSLDGGHSWSAQPVRVTDNQQVCHYGLKLSPRTKYDPANNGRIMLVYQIADLSRPLPPPINILADHVQWLYLAEAKNFPPPVAIDQRKPTAGVKGFELYQNYPNPFNPLTQIRFHIPQPERVTLEIFNILGQKIKTVMNRKLTAGDYLVSWNGQNEHGQQVASGVYIYRLKAGDFTASRKMLLVR